MSRRNCAEIGREGRSEGGALTSKTHFTSMMPKILISIKWEPSRNVDFWDMERKTLKSP